MPSLTTSWTLVRYPDDEMLKEAVWRDKTDFCVSVINSLPGKCRKCIELSRDYTENKV